MRWSLRMLKGLEPQDYKDLSLKDLQAIDRLLTQSVNKKLKAVHQSPEGDLGVSPAEKYLEQKGITIKDVMPGKEDYIKPEATVSEDALIDHIQKMSHFRDLKTSTPRGFKRYLEYRKRITEDKGISFTVFDVIDELKKTHRYKDAFDKYGDSDRVIEAIEVIIDRDEPETVEEAIGRLFGTWEAQKQAEEDLKKAEEELLSKYGVDFTGFY